METRNLSIDNITSQAWGLTKKHLLTFLVLTILMQIIAYIPNVIQYGDYLQIVLTSGDPALIEQMILEPASPAMQLKSSIATLICLIIAIYPTIVIYRLANDAARGEQPDLAGRLKDGFRGLGFFLIVYIVYCLLVGIGAVFCLLPGIFLAIRFLFAPLIAALHPERSFADCFSESWNITKGHFWTLFLMGIVVILLAILGMICCCVGVFVTNIITNFMLILTYRTLSGEADEPAEDFTSENLTVVSE